jgi:hypothetical protein
VQKIHTVYGSLTQGLNGESALALMLSMSTTLIEIRRAKLADAADVAQAHDDAWRAAYQGIIPGTELEKLINRRGPDWWHSAIRKGLVGQRTGGGILSRARWPRSGALLGAVRHPRARQGGFLLAVLKRFLARRIRFAKDNAS